VTILNNKTVGYLINPSVSSMKVDTDMKSHVRPHLDSPFTVYLSIQLLYHL